MTEEWIRFENVLQLGIVFNNGKSKEKVILSEDDVETILDTNRNRTYSTRSLYSSFCI